jgi:putative ABC transport system permease protein
VTLWKNLFGGIMQTLLQDLRYGARMLWKKPGFTIVAVTTLALGIGANTVIFSVVNAVLLRPFPYEAPERLVTLRERISAQDQPAVSYLNFTDWRSQNTVFDSMAMVRPFESFNFTGSGDPERLQGRIISASFFSTLGIKPIRGRDFLAEEDGMGAAPAVILSHEFWRRRFGVDESIIGKQITLNNQSFTVIGVTPANFQFGADADVSVPIGLSAERFRLRSRDPGVMAVARLKPGVSIAQAEAELNTIAARLERQYPETNTGRRVSIQSLHESVVGNVRTTLSILLGAVGLVLLIACANVANLLLVRAATRQRETAMRAALGASRFRIIRQLLTESVLLSALGGIFGTLIALWGTSLITSSLPDGIPRLREVGIDAWVFGFTLAISLLTGALFGLVPALQASRPNLTEALKEGGGRSTGNRPTLRNALVALEVALTLPLLLGAGLLINSFWRLQQVDPGFNPRNLLTMQISVNAGGGEGVRVADFFDQLQQKARSLPGVKSVAVSIGLPITGANQPPFIVEGRPRPEPGREPAGILYIVSPGYFETLGIQLLKGRGFTAQDTRDSQRVVVIDEALARLHFQNEDPVGKRLSLALPNGPTFEIVGVVRHVEHFSLDGQAPVQSQFYLNFNQTLPTLPTLVTRINLLIRSASDPLSMAAAARSQVWALNKDQPVFNTLTMEQIVSQSVAPRRFSALLLAVFAVVALALASVGIYGMISYSVAQRGQEIGIRMALGAQTRDVLALVVKQGMKPALLGGVIGLGASLLLARLLTNLLFGVSASDPLTFGAVALLLLGVALLACWVPARRATKVDPMIALRHE